MDRYSFLNGSRVDGTLVLFGGSASRAKFFTSLGATDPSALQRLTKQILNGFQILPEFENEPADTKPVAVRYAPMHLYRKKETASIKAFCAMNIAGDENRGDRISTYDHTFVWSVNEMCAGKQFNHVDLLFGTKLTGWQEVMRYRNKEGDFNYDRLPDKVNPEIKSSDIGLCIRCIEAIYAGKNVVIRIEKGHNFNTRSRDLLIQIYSLLQPKLAVEVGFASYQDPKKIAALANELSMRIFVLPAGCELSDVPAGFVVLDLAENSAGFRLEHSPLVDTLVKWLGYDFEKRLAAYRSIFADVTDYQNADLFVQRSEEFFAAEKALNEWKSTVKIGSVADMDQLREVYRQHIENSIVPWAIDEFTIRIPGMLAAGKTINGLLTDAAVGISTTSGDTQKQESERYLFGKNYGTVEVGKLSQELLAHQKKVSDAEWAPQLAAAQQKTLDAIADGDRRVAEEQQKAAAALAAANAAAAASLAAEQEKTRTAQAETVQAKAEGEQRLAEAQEAAQKTLAETKAAAEETLAATKAAAEQTLAREKQTAAETLAAANAAAAAALAAEQGKTQAAQAETVKAKEEGEQRLAEAKAAAEATLAAAAAAAEETLTQEKQKAAEALEQEKNRYEDLRRKAAEAYTTMKSRAESAEQNLADTKTALETAKTEHETEKARLLESGKAAVMKERRKAKEDAENFETRIAELKGMLNVNPDDVTGLRREIQTLKDTVSKQKDDVAAQKRKGIIGIVAGVLAGALVCGGIFTVIGLLNKEEVPPATEPTHATEPAVPETTVPETTVPETTVPETTEAVVIPEEFDWTNEACVEQLLQEVPELKTVDTENATAWLPEGIELGDAYTVTALLSLQEELGEAPEEGVEVEYMLVLKRAESAEEGADAADAQSTEGEESAAEGETEAQSEESAAEESVFSMRALEGVSMALESSDQILLIFGGEDTQKTALRVFSCCIPEEETFCVYVFTAEQTLDITPAVITMLGSTWWDQVDVITLDAEALQTVSEMLALSAAPAAYFGGSEKDVYFFVYEAESQFPDELKDAASAGAWEVIEFGQYAAVAVPVAEEEVTTEE